MACRPLHPLGSLPPWKCCQTSKLTWQIPHQSLIFKISPICIFGGMFWCGKTGKAFCVTFLTDSYRIIQERPSVGGGYLCGGGVFWRSWVFPLWDFSSDWSSPCVLLFRKVKFLGLFGFVSDPPTQCL